MLLSQPQTLEPIPTDAHFLGECHFFSIIPMEFDAICCERSSGGRVRA